MKSKLSKFLPVLVAGVALMLSSPAGALAQNRGGHGGGGYSNGRSYSGGGHGFVGGGRNYSDGRVYGGRSYGGGYYRGGRPYLGFGGGPYVYGPSYGYGYAPAPACGYYDRFGYWRAYPGCYANPYGY
jgi:hypothetical protein